MSAESKPLTRRKIASGLASDQQSLAAAASLMQMEAQMNAPRDIERLEVRYDLSTLYPSPKNPRRITLDAAGVTIEALDRLKIQPYESLESWRARYVEFLRELTEKGQDESEAVWAHLFDNAENIRRQGLIQPIVAQPNGEIIAGERRWCACRLANITHERVIVRHVSEDKVHLLRLIENTQRQDLSVAEITASLREIMGGLTKHPLSFDNPDLTLNLIMDVLGCKQTRATYFLALCRIEDDSPVLAQIMSGAFGGLLPAYRAVVKYRQDMRAQTGQESVPDAAGRSAGEDTDPPEGENGGTPASPTPPAKPSSPPGNGHVPPLVKMRLPGTAGGEKILRALKNIDDISNGVRAQIDRTITGWASAGEKSRKKMLAQVLDVLQAELELLDQEQQ